MDSLTEQGVAALRAGDTAAARALLSAAVRARPDDARAWLWLSGALDDPGQQRYCLERALALDPACGPARRGLEALGTGGAGELQPLAPQRHSGRGAASADGFASRPEPAERPAPNRPLWALWLRGPHGAAVRGGLPAPLAAALAGVSAALGWAAWAGLGAAAGPAAVGLAAAVGGAPLGLAALVIGGVLLRSGGRWLGGRAGAAEVRGAIGRALAPPAWGVLLWAAQLALLPAASLGGAEPDQARRLLAAGCLAVQGGLWLWAAARLPGELGAAHGFGPARGAAACALAALAVAAAAFATLGAAALIIGLRGG